MALCSVAEVQTYVTSRKLTVTDIENIITVKSKEIATKARSTTDASNNDSLNLACIHASAAQVLRNMKVNGELAASVKLGNDSTNNNIEPDILDHEAQAEYYIKKYRTSQGFSIPYGTSGPVPGSSPSPGWPYLKRIN